MQYQRVFILIVIGGYLILALGHYFNKRPLWNDEQCVLNNIKQQKPGYLFTRPLLNDQEFPRLYLWSIQQFSKFFIEDLSAKGPIASTSQNLLLLRLFSLMAMMGAFFVWLKVAHQALGKSWDLVFTIPRLGFWGPRQQNGSIHNYLAAFWFFAFDAF